MTPPTLERGQQKSRSAAAGTSHRGLGLLLAPRPLLLLGFFDREAIHVYGVVKVTLRLEALRNGRGK